METLPVLFRNAREDGETYLTAVFPTLPHDRAGTLITCYAHVGQHSACSRAWYLTTTPAKPEEYADLLQELRRIYERPHFPGDTDMVTLKVCKRISAAMRAEFNANAP